MHAVRPRRKGRYKTGDGARAMRRGGAGVRWRGGACGRRGGAGGRPAARVGGDAARAGGGAAQAGGAGSACFSSGWMSSMMPGVSSGTARRMPSYRSRERSVPMPSSVYSSLSSAPPTGGTRCARVTPCSRAPTQWPHSASTDATVQLAMPSNATLQLSSANSSASARSCTSLLASPSRIDCTCRSPISPS